MPITAVHVDLSIYNLLCYLTSSTLQVYAAVKAAIEISAMRMDELTPGDVVS